jgi:CRISPR-associated protein Csm5
VYDRWSEATMRDLVKRIETEEAEGKRIPRNPGTKAEEAVLGGSGKSIMRRVSAGDSASISHSGMKVYLLRTSTLIAKGEGKYELGWKSARGTAEARRIDDSTPTFAEMAAPDTAFEGVWSESSERDRAKIFQAANRFALSQLSHHKQYAQWTGLAPLAATVDGLESKIQALSGRQNACVLSIGWGGGVLSKISAGDTTDASYRSLAKRVAFYDNALRTGLPFPKTRRIVFQDGKAAQLPGFVLLELI